MQPRLFPLNLWGGGAGGDREHRGGGLGDSRQRGQTGTAAARRQQGKLFGLQVNGRGGGAGECNQQKNERMNERTNELKDLGSRLFLKVLRLQNAMTTIGLKNLHGTSAMSLFVHQHMRYTSSASSMLVPCPGPSSFAHQPHSVRFTSIVSSASCWLFPRGGIINSRYMHSPFEPEPEPVFRVHVRGAGAGAGAEAGARA